MTGAQNIIHGLLFNNQGNIRCRGTNNHIIGNKMTGFNTAIPVGNSNDTGGGNYCEIAYNEIYSPRDWNDSYPPTEIRMGVRMSTASGFDNTHKHVWLHHNHFHDFPTKPIPSQYSSGQSDAIEVCEAGYEWVTENPGVRVGWYIEYNLVEDHLQGHGIVDLKCGGVYARYNHLKNTNGGQLDIRNGNGSVLESNYMQNTGGMNVHRRDHNVVCNFLTGGGDINLFAGNIPITQSGTQHGPATDVFVGGNTGTLNVGYGYDSSYTFDATGTVIEDHTGTINYLTESSTTKTPGAANSYACIDAEPLDAIEVGPPGLDLASAAYKAARGL
jgi:hypothetical protein